MIDVTPLVGMLMVRLDHTGAGGKGGIGVATRGETVHDEHEGSPGMDMLTIVYCVLFFGLYLFYFWLVANRWPVS